MLVFHFMGLKQRGHFEFQKALGTLNRVGSVKILRDSGLN